MRPLGSLGPFELCQKRFLRSRKRRRYTDQSAQAQADHQKVEMGHLDPLGPFIGPPYFIPVWK